MIVAIVILIISVVASILIYTLTPLVGQWYWFWVPIVLVPVLFEVLGGILILCTGFVQIFTDKSKPQAKPSKFVKWLVNELSFVLFMISNTTIHVTGYDKVPQNARCLFVSNHTSNFDPIVLFCIYHKRTLVCISKPEIWDIPIAGALAHRYGFIKINRNDAREAIKSINQAADNLKNDISDIVIYPEGTRSKTLEMIEFHHGSFKIATKAEAPIVICSLQNPYMIAHNAPFKRTHVYLDVLEVLYPEQYKDMSTGDIAKYVQDKIQKNLDEHANRKVMPKKLRK